MESSTQEDSLVFATQKRHSDPSWPWSDPQKPSQTAADDTLVDQEGAESEEDDSFLFPRTKNSSSPQRARFFGTSTSFSAQRDSRRGYDTLGDTQVIRHQANDTISESETSFLAHPIEPAPIADTQVILRPIDDTQVIPRFDNDTQVVGELRDNLSFIDGSEDIVIPYSGSSIQNSGIPQDQHPLADTQVLPSARKSYVTDTQADSVDNTGSKLDQQDTQIIGNPPGFSQNHVLHNMPALRASPISEYEPTQQDRDAGGITAIDSSPTKVAEVAEAAESERNAEFSPSTPQAHESPFARRSDSDPDLAFSQTSPESSQEGSVTFDVSIEGGAKNEPTTQVLNTQEEYMDDGYENPVDLSCKPVYSSSQHEDHRRIIRESIESDEENDDDDNEENDNSHEMGSPTRGRGNARLKRRKITVTSSSQSNGTHSKGSEPSLQIGKTMASLVNTEKSGGAKLQGNIYSDSSSELEDISQDVHGMNLDSLPKSSEDMDCDVATLPATPKKDGKQTLRLKEGDTQREEMAEISTPEVIQNPMGVWALHQFKKFPAKIVEYGEVFSLVQFSENHQIEARNSDLHLLDICVGDTIQLKMRHGEYVVVGLMFYTTESVIRCIRGYDTVIISKKSRSVAAGPAEEFMISLEDICMELDQWAVHQSRFHIMKGDFDLLSDNYNLVHEFVSSDPVSPAKVHDAAVALENKTYVSPRKPIKDLLSTRKSDLFTGVLFFVTSIEGPRKTRLKELIESHGGVLVDDEIKNVTIRKTTSVGKQLSPRKNLAPFKFCALLSNGYSRSAKYLQALTLGWPILADCFVDKVIEDRAFLTNWQVFLLPAGHSIHTSTITNLDVYDFRAQLDSGKLLSEQLQNNAILLNGYTMIILDRKQDSKMIDMCDFIFHAFGASNILVSKTPTEVDSHLTKAGLQKYLVYDNSQHEYIQSHDAKTNVRKSSGAARTKVGVIDWEWVVQCVISKYIWAPTQHVDI